ncbi:MAG: DUF5060 domain-containing protein [Saprospiraceae bacterium]
MYCNIQLSCLPALLAGFLLFAAGLSAQAISGELKTWHRITLTFTGPESSETASPNPFTDYRLDVTFSKDGTSYTVPGFFAADGDAAETSAESGDRWRVHFAPDDAGEWTYAVSFKTGTDVAVDGGGVSAGFMDGAIGSFTVTATDKTGRDNRARGRLNYVGEHYLQYAGTGEWFVKAGADAPENTLAYDDFDATPNVGNRRKSWQPHAQDYDGATAGSYTWQGGRGSELLGVINYLAGKEMNAFSFLTFNVEGDDKNVFPHLLSVPISNYNGNNWDSQVFHDRFDVSKLEQWERIFSYADLRGMYLHFKLQETENNDLMDGGNVGRERKLYFRELIARFSHHLALNWNMGEENTQTTQQRRQMADYFAQNDPYDHLRVIHTYPGQKNQVYTPLLGNNSSYTGLSLQTSNPSFNEVFSDTDEWVGKSEQAGKKWVVAVDEPGSANIGIDSDPDDRKLVRHKVVWATFMAGGAGTEFYYGYQSGCGDLNCQDHRTRDQKYTDAAFALQFFQLYFQPYFPALENVNGLTADNNDYVLAKPGEAYAVYRPNGGSTAISLPVGSWTLRWYNPRTGELNGPQNFGGNTLTAPDNEDWVALIEAGDCAAGNACDDGDACTVADVLDTDCNCAGQPAPDSDSDGVCDPEDNCPGFDNDLIGTPCDDGDAATTNDTYRQDCECRGSLAGIDQYLEAECAEYGNAFSLVVDSEASEGSLLQATDGATYIAAPPVGDRYLIRFRVAVPAAGSYRIFARTLSTGDDDDSFWVRAGCSDWVRWNKIDFPYTTGGLTWNQVSDWSSGDVETLVTFELEAGLNLIEFAYREPDVRLDKIYLTPEMTGPEADGPGGDANNCSTACMPGAVCDDGNPMTTNDRLADDCACVGVTSCVPLPVEWLDFRATPGGGSRVLLTWETAAELNAEKFVVEHSRDNRSFTALSEVAAAGNSAEVQSYTAAHASPAAGINYYRIRQVDYDGSYGFSPVRSVTIAGEGPKIYPNPVTAELVVVIGASEEVFAQLVDGTGRVVMAVPLLPDRPNALDVRRLPAGVYSLMTAEWSRRIVITGSAE